MITLINTIIKYLINLICLIVFTIDRILTIANYFIAWASYSVYLAFSKEKIDFTLKETNIRFLASQNVFNPHLIKLEYKKKEDMHIYPMHISYNSITKTGKNDQGLFQLSDLYVIERFLGDRSKKLRSPLINLFNTVDRFIVSHLFVQALRITDFINPKIRESMSDARVQYLYKYISVYKYNQINTKFIISDILYHKLEETDALKNINEEDIIIYDVKDGICRPLSKYDGIFDTESFNNIVMGAFRRQERSIEEFPEFIMEMLETEVVPDQKNLPVIMESRKMLSAYLLADMVLLEITGLIKDMFKAIFFVNAQVSYKYYFTTVSGLLRELFSRNINTSIDCMHTRISIAMRDYGQTVVLGMEDKKQLIDFFKKFRELCDQD